MRIRFARGSQTEPDLTPMISVVLLLVTVFMLLSRFEKSAANERGTLPRDQLASPPPVHRQNSFVLKFGFRRDLDGTITDQTPSIFFGDDQVALDQVRPRLQQQAEYFETIGIELANVTVEIMADAEIPAGMVQELIQICQEQGIAFQRFALKAIPPTEGF